MIVYTQSELVKNRSKNRKTAKKMRCIKYTFVVLNTTSYGTISYEPVDPQLWTACMWGMHRDPGASVDRQEVH